MLEKKVGESNMRWDTKSILFMTSAILVALAFIGVLMSSIQLGYFRGDIDRQMPGALSGHDFWLFGTLCFLIIALILICVGTLILVRKEKE